MLFPWNKYEELAVGRRNTLQVFITNKCNLNCNGCFAKAVMKDDEFMSLEEYQRTIKNFLEQGGEQINILGGEPLLHQKLGEILDTNRKHKIKTTIYTNGYYLKRFNKEFFDGIKLRISLYCKTGGTKSTASLPKTDIPIEVCFMVSSSTTLKELLETAKIVETEHDCNVFFISSIRELDNPHKEFFEDTPLCMNVLEYKKLVHEFLKQYDGNMEIHISKRGVFESTKNMAENKCRFANQFIGGKTIQCPYDVINSKFQEGYSFGKRHCQQNNTCLMSKIAVKRIPT